MADKATQAINKSDLSPLGKRAMQTVITELGLSTTASDLAKVKAALVALAAALDGDDAFKDSVYSTVVSGKL